MRKHKLHVILLVLFYQFFSLQSVAQSYLSDTLVINNLLDNAEKLLAKNPAESKNLVDSAFQISEKFEIAKFRAKVLRMRVNVSYYLGDYKKAVNDLHQILPYYTSIKDTAQISMVYNDLGTIYSEMAKYPEAIENLLEALEIRGENSPEDENAITLANLGLAHLYAEEYSYAHKYLNEALVIFERLNHSEGIATVNSNIGMTFNNEGNNKDAIKYFLLSLGKYEEIENLDGVANIYNHLGKLYSEEKEYEESLNYLKKSIELRRNMNDNNGLLYALHNYAYTSFKNDDYKSAVKYWDEALKLADIENDKRILSLIFKNSGEAYNQLGNYKLAFDHYKNYSELYEEIFNREKNEQFEKLKVEFETEKKEAEITSLKEITANRQIIIFLLIGFLMLLLILGYSGYLRYRLKVQQRAMELEQRLLRSQMNPHFIFNSLSVIQGYIFKGSSTEASNYLSNFGKLMRHILENSREEYVALSKELETLELYLELQNIRHDNSINYNIETEGFDDADSVKIPPMIAQPYIENSIKHGMKGKDNISIQIFYKLFDEKIECIIEDDGIGINHSETEEIANHKSLSTEITKERIKLLSKKQKLKFDIQVDDLSELDNEKSGTRIKVDLPFVENF